MRIISADGDEYEMFKGHSALDDIAMLENLLTQVMDDGVSPDGETSATTYDDTTGEDWSPQEVLVYLRARYGAKIHGDATARRNVFGCSRFRIFQSRTTGECSLAQGVVGEFEADPKTMRNQFEKCLSSKGLLPRRGTYAISAEICDPYSCVYRVTLRDRQSNLDLFYAISGEL